MWLAWVSMVSAMVGGELRWEAPAGACPSAAEVRARIDEAGGLGELDVEAVITEESPQGWAMVLTVTLDDVSDERVLRSEACAELADAAVLLVGTRLDEARAAIPERKESTDEEPPKEASVHEIEGPGQEPAPEPEPEPEPRPQLESPAPAPQPRRTPLPTGLTLGAGIGIGLGSVPAPGVPVEIAIGYAWPRLRVALRGRDHIAPMLDVGEDARARVLLGTAGPEVCARPSWRRVEFPLCAQVSVGGNRVLVRGAARPRGAVWVEAGADAGVAWFVARRWALTARLGGAAPLLASGYVRGDETVWAPAPVGGRVMFGVEFIQPIQNRGRPEKTQ